MLYKGFDLILKFIKKSTPYFCQSDLASTNDTTVSRFTNHIDILALDLVNTPTCFVLRFLKGIYTNERGEAERRQHM